MIPYDLLNLGLKGITRLIPREKLGTQYAYKMVNCRPFKGKVQTSPGRSRFSATTLSGRPLKVFMWAKDDSTLLLNICTSTKIYRYNSSLGTFVDITRSVGGDYTGGNTNFWDAVSFNNIGVFTNLTDNIQKWDGAAANVVDLAGSPPKAGCLAAFQTYLLLGNLASNIRGVQWSDTGNPESWTPGGASDAGSLTLFQDPGKIYRLLPLGEVCVAYREYSLHNIFYVGTPFVFGQRQIYSSGGLIGPRAVVDLGPFHLYWGDDNVYAYNGAERMPVANDIFDEMIYGIDSAYRTSILAVHEINDREVFFCYPEPGNSGLLTKAWVFNYMLNTWREETLDISAGGRWRNINPTPWDSLVGTWDAQTQTWDQIAGGSQQHIAVVTTPAGVVRYIDRDTVDVEGSARERYFETGIFNPGSELFQKPGIKCTLEQIRIECEKFANVTLEVSVGTQERLGGDSDITWTSYSFNSGGTSPFLSINKTSNFFTFKIRTTTGGGQFRISGLTAFFNERGNR